MPQPSRGVFGIASLADTTYALLNQQFGTGSNPYTDVYAWEGMAGVCASSAEAGNWQQAPDVITDKRKTVVTDINTIVSDMDYTVADVAVQATTVCSAVLPVQFLSFTGTYNNGSVLLNWQIANEINTQSFTVERSTDGGSRYSAAGMVAAFGSGSYAYSFIDRNLPGGTLLYRIRTTDTDGRESYSNSVVISLPLVTTAVVYPSPAKGKVTVRLSLSKAVPLQVAVMTVTGQTVLQQTVAGSAGIFSQTLDVSKLPAGVYLIRIIGGNKNETLRFQKE